MGVGHQYTNIHRNLCWLAATPITPIPPVIVQVGLGVVSVLVVAIEIKEVTAHGSCLKDESGVLNVSM